jgi:pantetheine-phosphate adenylyltransferase
MKALYPGSFDPFTIGHAGIVSQAFKIFDEIVIAVMQNPAKPNSFFSAETRRDIIKLSYGLPVDGYHINGTAIDTTAYIDTEIPQYKSLSVIIGEGASVNVALEYGCSAMIRGVRGSMDIDFEMSLDNFNRHLSDDKLTTVCLFPRAEDMFVSSSAVRELYRLGALMEKIQPFVGKAALTALDYKRRNE